MNERRKVYQEIAEQVKRGRGWTTRRRLSIEQGMHKTTAQSHLERCVRDGLLVRYWGFDQEAKQYGWVYETANTVPMFGMVQK